MAKMTLVKEVKNAKLFNDENGNPLIRIDNGRFSYPFVGTPSEDENDNNEKVKRWRAVHMLPKATHAEAKKLIDRVIAELLAANGNAKVAGDKLFVTDGDEKEDELMHGHWLISAADPRVRPKARNARGEVMDDISEIDDMFYGGSWGHMLIRPWFFGGKSKNSSKTFPKRVSAGLNAVVFWKDDKPFGTGRIDDEDAWGGLPAQESNAGMDDDEEM